MINNSNCDDTSKSKNKTYQQSKDIDKSGEKHLLVHEDLENNSDPNRLQAISTQDGRDVYHDNKSPSFHAKGKPRVVVPSPKGIPRPEPISTITDTGKRSSIISTDSMSDEEFFLYDMDRKP